MSIAAGIPACASWFKLIKEKNNYVASALTTVLGGTY